MRKFVKRYDIKLKSIHLRNMNRDRMKSEYASVFKHFYDLINEKFENLNENKKLNLRAACS